MINNSNQSIFYHIYNPSNPNFNIKLQKTSINRIIQLYGEEPIKFNSFIIDIITENTTSIVTQKKTMKKELDDTEANRLSEGLNNLGKYFIVPESLKSLNEDKQYEQSIRIKGKYITHIMKKAGIKLESMIYYLGLQIISQEISESIVIDFLRFEKIFKLIPILSTKFKNKNNLDIAFYSFRQILKNCGIKLDEILPFLHISINNLDRNSLNYNEMPLCKALEIRQLKELISPEEKNMNIDLIKGTDTLKRIDKNNFDDLDIFRNEQSNLLNDIIKKIEMKKEEIRKQYENEENQIIEIKKEDKVFYLKKNLYDNLNQNIENNDDMEIKDIKGDDIILNKEFIKENEDDKKEPFLSLNKNNGNKKEFILITKNDLENKFKGFNYIKQEEDFSGKGINGEPKELKGLFMEINCELLSNFNDDIIPIDIINENNEVKESQSMSPQKENNNEIKDISPNSKEKLKSIKPNQITSHEIEPEYEDIINPYNNLPFKQIKNMRIEEDKNNDDKLKSLNEKEINSPDKKTYRIRRAILFKKPSGDKEKEKEKEKEKKIC